MRTWLRRRGAREFRLRGVYRVMTAAVAVSLTVVSGVFLGISPAAAAAGAFVCQPGFFQVISGQLNTLNPVTGAYTPIGAAAGNYNAIGYDTLDNYIYGMSTVTATQAHLLRIASDGTVTDLGLPTGLPVANYVSGDFDDAGNLIIQASATSYYSINVATRIATHLTITGATGSANDMVWIGGTVYSMSNTTLVAVNLATDVATSATVPGVSGSFGAGWSDNPDELFFSDNNTGKIYKITNFTTASPTGTLAFTGAVTGNNDGAACKLADSPFNVPTANADSYAATTNLTLSVPAASGVLANDSGSDLTAAKVTGPSHGTLTLNSDGSFTYTPTVGYVGSDTFTYTATDQYGRTSTPATVTVTVALPAAPTAVADNVSTPVSTTLTVAAAGVLANDSGTGITVTSNTQPTHGTVTVNANGSLTLAPTPGYSGPDSFQYTIADSFARTSTATVTVTITPTTAADSYSTAYGQTLTTTAGTGVLANDSGTGLAALVLSQPAHGVLVLNSDGSFSYTPTAGYAGPDSFTYRASDGTSTSPATAVTLTVGLPTAPVATDDTGYTTAASTTLTVSAGSGVLANDSGTAITVTSTTQPAHGTVTVTANGSFTLIPTPGSSGPDSFQYTITDGFARTSTATVIYTVTPVAVADTYAASAGSPLVTTAADGVLHNDTGTALAASVVTGPAHGTLTLHPDGSFTYTPTTGYTGTDSFTYRASDATTSTASTPVTIVVTAPVPPTVTDDTYTTAAGTTLTVPAGDGVLTNDTGTSLTTTAHSQPTHGSVTVGADGSFAYTPDGGYSGPDSFAYAATDPFGQVAVGIVHLTVTPAASTATYTTTTAQALSLPAPGLLSHLTGTGLTLTGYTQPAHGTVVVYPDGSMTYTPTPGYVGPDSFTYTAADTHGQTVTGTVEFAIDAASIVAEPTPTGSSTLPFTGVPTTTQLGIAITLLLTGGPLLLIARRRRDAHR
jgi:hypothetical protein